jgi:general secretion pathway protein G
MAKGKQFSRICRTAHARGMTLIEIMIVVAIIAMVMGAVAVVAIPKMKEAQISTCRSAVRTVRSAVQQWQLSNNDYSSCPTVSQLVQDKQLDSAQATTDPWGGDFLIKCEGDDVVVSSNGPDKKQGGTDDIVIPQVAAATEP